MTDTPPLNKINELKLELQQKDKEINEYLDKIEHLENLIMEIEASISEKSDKTNNSLSKIRLKDLENTNQELKRKLSFSRLENVKLKQELEKIKKGYFDSASLIQVVSNKRNSNNSETAVNKEAMVKEENKVGEELFKYIQIKCPKCETIGNLKIPIKIISQTQNLTTISIPKGMICEHSFQILIDKFFTIKRYHIRDYEFQKLEYYTDIDNINLTEKEDDLSYLTSFPFYQQIINIFRESIDDREILGTAIFTEEGKLIYASVPSNIIFNIIKEFEVRMEKRLQDITKMYIEVKHHQKIFLDYIKILNSKIIVVLIFSKKVNFGMGTMILKDLKTKVKMLIGDYKEGEI
ncbi:MAG: hypothetical protein ACFFDF_19500 [Candidatus Odinarchaeota archaeon]